MGINWQEFERKLSRGKTLSQAAEELGVTYELVKEKYDDARHAQSVYGLESVGSEAIQTAIAVLEDIATSPEATPQVKVDAAGHLLKFATAALRAATDRRRATTQKNVASGILDLFDVAGDWDLKKPGV